jgi:hypothetical protein
MQVEIVGYEETRAIVGDKNPAGEYTSLRPDPTQQRYFLNVKFPDGTVKKMETDQEGVEKYLELSKRTCSGCKIPDCEWDACEIIEGCPVHDTTERFSTKDGFAFGTVIPLDESPDT